MGGPHNGADVVGLDEVLITDRLALRPVRQSDPTALNRALLAINREIANRPEQALQRIAEASRKMCRADSAGISILEEGREQFRWEAVVGELQPHLGQTIPRLSCPCNAAIAGTGPVLLADPERHFPVLRALKPRVHEALLMPWSIGGQPRATLWVAHHEGRQFDAQDVQLLSAFADLASCAWQVLCAGKALRERQGELTRIEEKSRALARGNADLHQEVKQRREAEAALREQEARLSAMFESLPVGVGVFQNDGRVLLANPEMLRYLPTGHMPSADPVRRWRWSAETADGSPIEPRDFPIARALRGERVVPGMEMCYIQDDGQKLWTQVASVPVRDAEGHVSGQVGVITDITELKHATQALRESEALFRALAEGALALIWRVDAQGNATYFNPRYLEVTGRSAASLMASGWHDILHPEDAQAYLERVALSLKERQSFQGRARVLTKDGSWRWFETYGAPLFSARGQYTGQVGLSTDIDDAVRAEEALKEADRRKDVFLATLAHELRNPLAPITNGLHLLRYQGGRRDADRIISIVQRQLIQLVRLVDDLMEVSRITRGKLELRRETARLDDIIRAAIEVSEPGIKKAGHALELSLPAETLMLDADPVRLTQVFANLLNNAARYTEQPGQIRISVAREGDQALVSVSDTGIGLAPEQLNCVFDMFVQVRQIAGPHKGGLGIGLTLVRNLVQMHGGTVEARSEGLGRGSQFVVRLPLLAINPASVPQHLPVSLPQLSGLRMLVVDDNRDAADTLRMMLHDAGAQVRAVYDGPSALAALPTLRPEVAILDIGMPGMDGYELARHIRDIAQFREIKIYSLSGWGQGADRARALSMGFDCHLTKPLDLALLNALLSGQDCP